MAGAKQAAIIAIKGYPCTGKSTLARSLAKALKCPVIDHETVFNCMVNAQPSPPNSSTVAAEAERLNDLSYEPVCQMALAQLRLKLMVIIDTSLSRRYHLDRLLEISKSSGARLIVIECKALNKFEWKIRLQRRQGEANGIISWYKPSTWDDLEMLLERYDWCTDYDVQGISKLVVDSTGCHRNGEFSIVNPDPDADSEHTHLEDVLKWIRKEGLGELGLVDEKVEELRHLVERIGHPSRHTHRLALSGEENINDGKNIACRKCLELITAGPVYECTECDLSLHKSCAELPHKKVVFPHHLSPLVDPTSGKYSFPEKHSCPFHADANMGFLDDCEDCLFHTSLRCGLFPMVLRHRLHDKPLFFFIFPIASDTEFMCTACGETSKYMAFYTCRTCGFELHVKCALLPFSFKHKIHRHPLRLAFLHEDDGSDEYYCDVCEKYRNPNHMMYYCSDCYFTCHLSCMNFVP